MIKYNKHIKQMKNIKGLKTVLTIATLAALIGLGSCYRDKADQLYPNSVAGITVCDTATVTFSGTIKPIIDQHCALSGCHDGSNASTWTMQDYNSIITYCVSTNKLIGSIKHESGFVAMPQGAPKLDDCTISKFEVWVNSGAMNN